MTQFSDTFYYLWMYLFVFSFPAAFIGLIVLMYAKKNEPSNKNKLYLRGSFLIAQLFFVGISAVCLQGFTLSSIRSELRKHLRQSDLSIKIDDSIADSMLINQLINDLQTIRGISPHHSHTIKSINVVILAGKESINLSLEQDSQNETEYRVFWDKYRLTKTTEVGSINTDCFK